MGVSRKLFRRRFSRIETWSALEVGDAASPAAQGAFGTSGRTSARVESYARVRSVVVLTLVAVAALSVTPGLMAAPGTTSRVNIASDGSQAEGGSGATGISADGRFVAFVSGASNFVPGDTNNLADVFVHDRLTRSTTRVSIASDGTEANGEVIFHDVAISADGQVVAFASWATNLVAGDTNGDADVFVHDRETGDTSRVSVTSAGQEVVATSKHPSISGDGRYIAFESCCGEFVPGDAKNANDIYVHDRETGDTEWISAALDASENRDSDEPVISDDGRYVSFRSNADLTPEDTDGALDIFVYDRETGETEGATPSRPGEDERAHVDDPHDISADGRFVAFVSPDSGIYGEVLVYDRLADSIERVSVAANGGEANSESYAPTISADGRYVAFKSSATNLVTEETEGGLFVRDRQTGTTSRVGAAEEEPDISANGRLLAYVSSSSDLVPGDTNELSDVFVYELEILDSTPPTVEYTGNAGTYTVDQVVDINCMANDQESGIASTTCEDIAGPAYSFEIGTNSFSATAIDFAGNVGTANNSFTVKVTSESLAGVVEVLVADTELARSLLIKLERNAIPAFINHVEAQRGKRISMSDADLLIDLATSLL